MFRSSNRLTTKNLNLHNGIISHEEIISSRRPTYPPTFLSSTFKMFSCLINDKISLKQQLLISYSLITIVSAGITLSICYGLLYSLKASASKAAKENLIQQTHSNAQALATEIANTINQEIAVVGESVCMVNARYASILHNYARSGSRNGTILKRVY
jgi:hypothetical protein